MTEWFVFGLYSLPVVPVWRREMYLSYERAKHALYRQVDDGDLVFSCIVGLVRAFGWPLVVGAAFLSARSETIRRGADAFMLPPKWERERALKVRIEELEREVLR